MSPLLQRMEKAVFPCIKNKLEEKPFFNLLIKRVAFLGYSGFLFSVFFDLGLFFKSTEEISISKVSFDFLERGIISLDEISPKSLEVIKAFFTFLLFSFSLVKAFSPQSFQTK